jgi:predicted ATPase/class 3 adenylate cyclase
MSNSASVTFLFTDIEGSTRMWELHPDAMAAALDEHNELLNGIFGVRGGRVFKTVGDSFCCAFTDPVAAVAAAVEAERALHAHAWPTEIGELRVRMAIHTGAVSEVKGDYFGPTVNRVARLLSIAHGEQVLLTSAAAAALQNVDLQGIALRDLGSHRLKDLKQAEVTYQVVAEGLRGEFPALASLDAHPNNLPSQISSFIGRQQELTLLRERLGQYRVVTIAGPGGIGKTRLALQLAAEAVANYPDGVYFVALAPIASGDLVVHALAEAFGISEITNEALDTTILRFIGSRSMLLVFDNSEHVHDDTALLVKRVVTECPNVRCVVTGREPLHLTGEYVERLLPLTTPAHAQTLSELEASDGTRLFLERARAVTDGRVALSPEDCALVAEICRRLDGMPLAIEIAASRLATMPLRRLGEKLSSILLINPDPTASRRHRTLRDAIEWSYRLLDTSEQRVFLALSVFHGGCTIGAIEWVAEGEIDERLGSLVDKSLVQVDLDEVANSRYRLLEPIADFARLELTESALGPGFRQRHFDCFCALAESASRADLAREMDNLRAALDWACEHDPESAAQLARKLGPFWRVRGSFSEGRSWFRRLLAPNVPLSLGSRAGLLRQSAGFAAMQDDYEQSSQDAQAAFEIYGDLGDEAGIGSALHTMAEVAQRQGRLREAERLYDEAWPHLDAASYLPGKTMCLMNQGMLARENGQYVAASELLRRADELAGQLHDRSVWAEVRTQHAWSTLYAGEADAAEGLFREALEAKEAERDLYGVCQARLGAATANLMASRADPALRGYRAVIEEAVALRAQIFQIEAIYGIAAVYALDGDLLAAARYCGLASQLVERTRCEPRRGFAYAIVTEKIGAGLTDEQRMVAMTAGASMRLEDVTAAF